MRARMEPRNLLLKKPIPMTFSHREIIIANEVSGRNAHPTNQKQSDGGVKWPK
jgi:hypothetical protein